MVNLLLLTCGTNASYHLAKTIKENFCNKFKIVGTDINEEYLVASIKYIDKFYKVPYSKSNGYYKIILDICKKEKINFLIPCFDADQLLFNSDNEDLKNLGVVSFGIPKSTCGFYYDKLHMFEYLSSCGMPLPHLYRKSDLDKEQYYFIKPVDGSGSIGAKKIKGSEINKINEDSFLLQEFCVEPEYTAECFYYLGELRVIMRERISSKAGVCTKAHICYKDEIFKIIESFINCMDLPVCFNLQFMKNEKGCFVITDVNLRLAGGMSIAAVAGWDEAIALAKIMLGEDKDSVFVSLPKIVSEQYVVRAYTDIITKIVKPVVAFDLDGTLLDSRERHSTVLDFILKKYNLNIETSDLIEYKRKGKSNFDYLISKGVSELLAKKVQNEWISIIENNKFLKGDHLYPNSIEMLEKYASNNDLILVTARKNKTHLLEQIKLLGIDKYFVSVYVVKPGNSSINDKAIILKENKVCLMIGDTVNDYKAACIAGVRFVHVNHGFHSKELLGQI